LARQAPASDSWSTEVGKHMNYLLPFIVTILVVAILCTKIVKLKSGAYNS